LVLVIWSFLVGRPWHIWFLFALGLAGVAAAFGWLTVKALELDRAELLARRQAELEEDISRALWRMDSVLAPLLSEEAARPDYVYRAVVSPGPSAAASAKAPLDRELSPLLTDRPEFVLVHFELNADGRLSSPQCPSGDDLAWVLERGATEEAIRRARAYLAELAPQISYVTLLAQIPSPSLPVWTRATDGRDAQQAVSTSQAAIVNPYEDVVQQQFKNLNTFPSQQPEPPPTLANSPAQGQQSDESLLRGNQAGGNGGSSQAFSNQGANSIESGRLNRSQTRVGNDLAKREAALQSYAQKSVAEQRANPKAAAPPIRIVEGASRPLWLADRLLVARRVQIGDQTVIQGCWLDWSKLQKRLHEEVADLLPRVTFLPVYGTEPIKLSRLLAALPVQLVVPPLSPVPATWTPIRVSLFVAWVCLLLTAAMAAVLLHSVMALSERRGAFVSAVTHELRTPLTTFRMYAEMLSEGMVPDATQRQKYLETLRIEADRLAHLVENVLQYARLERGRPGQRREEVSLATLLDRCQSRLADRTAQAEMKLDLQLADADAETTIATDSAAVEQILFNLVDNACKYAAASIDKRIHVSLAAEPRQVQLIVRDHGPGISTTGRKKLFQPFSKSVHEAASTAPGVGLGLALSRRLAAELGGRLELQSPSDGGAAFVLTLPR
jgi:signal transduction histidine kinase